MGDRDTGGRRGGGLAALPGCARAGRGELPPDDRAGGRGVAGRGRRGRGDAAAWGGGEVVSGRGAIGVGVIGLGFMGRVHAGAYARARSAGVDCRLVAVGDPRPAVAAARTGENLQVGEGEQLGAEVRRYASAAEVLRDADVELVSICTPTDTHAALAVEALEAGKHVLLEKPVATTAEEVARVAAAARGSGRLLVPAMCMRLWRGGEGAQDGGDEVVG